MTGAGATAGTGAEDGVRLEIDVAVAEVVLDHPDRHNARDAPTEDAEAFAQGALPAAADDRKGFGALHQRRLAASAGH